jgi:hypothetical protein
MKLFNLEYETKLGQTFTCRIVGRDEHDAVNDIVSVVGEITVLSIYYVSEIHRLSSSIRKQIVENSIKQDITVKKIGRPRKYEIFGE